MVAEQGKRAWTWGRACHCPEGSLGKVALDIWPLLYESRQAKEESDGLTGFWESLSEGF